MSAQNLDSGRRGCPMQQAVPPVSSGDLTYNDYLKVADLLRLQKPLSIPVHQDELLFITIHQSYELWFKLILHEMQAAILDLKSGQILPAHHCMTRAAKVMAQLVQQIHLLETMRPIDFLKFRDHLVPASGFQSVQFREIEFLSGAQNPIYLEYFVHRPEFLERLRTLMAQPHLRGVYYEALRGLGYALPQAAADLEDEGGGAEIVRGLLPIYQHPTEHFPVYLLSEALMDFDQQLSHWREHHVRVVERVIGTRPGTGGSTGVQYLQTTTHKKCFPLLWSVRAELTGSMSPSALA